MLVATGDLEGRSAHKGSAAPRSSCSRVKAPGRGRRWGRRGGETQVPGAGGGSPGLCLPSTACRPRAEPLEFTTSFHAWKGSSSGRGQMTSSSLGGRLARRPPYCALRPASTSRREVTRGMSPSQSHEATRWRRSCDVGSASAVSTATWPTPRTLARCSLRLAGRPRCSRGRAPLHPQVRGQLDGGRVSTNPSVGACVAPQRAALGEVLPSRCLQGQLCGCIQQALGKLRPISK